MGRDCRFYQHVTIGSAWSGGGAPGEGVPKIGNGAVIGANAVATKSAPAGYVAVGVPARIRETK